MAMLRESFVETMKIVSRLLFILAGVAILGYFLALTRLPSHMADWISDLRLPRYVTLFVILIYFILLEVIFFAWQIKLAKNDSKKSDEASRMKSAKTFRIVCASCLCAIILFAVINVNTYTEYREDGISEKFFVTTKEYDWQNVLYYSLSCDRYGEIEFNIKMKDGKTFELLNTVTSCSDEFMDKYENMYGYAAYLASEFESQPNYIEKRLSGADYMEDYYKESHPDVWKYLSAIIGEEEDGEEHARCSEEDLRQRGQQKFDLFQFLVGM